MPKQLKPSLRERNRYLSFKVVSEKKTDRKAIVDAIWKSHMSLFGEVGASRTSLWIMDFDENSNMGIAKVNRKSLPEMRATLSLMKEINGGKAAVSVFCVSGTLKKAREAMPRS
jgi:ribonuclease P/MRP protein subunit POP5